MRQHLTFSILRLVPHSHLICANSITILHIFFFLFWQILRNHVMVRIGGGWDTLQNYLNRHDPCRCASKGKTCITYQPYLQRYLHFKTFTFVDLWTQEFTSSGPIFPTFIRFIRKNWPKIPWCTTHHPPTPDLFTRPKYHPRLGFR